MRPGRLEGLFSSRLGWWAAHVPTHGSAGFPGSAPPGPPTTPRTATAPVTGPTFRGERAGAVSPPEMRRTGRHTRAEPMADEMVREAHQTKVPLPAAGARRVQRTSSGRDAAAHGLAPDARQPRRGALVSGWGVPVSRAVDVFTALGVVVDLGGLCSNS
jgi:hypothetical protein